MMLGVFDLDIKDHVFSGRYLPHRLATAHEECVMSWGRRTEKCPEEVLLLIVGEVRIEQKV
jgi:hypothetical protein